MFFAGGVKMKSWTMLIKYLSKGGSHGCLEWTDQLNSA